MRSKQTSLTRVGQLDLLTDLVKDLAPLTKAQEKLINASELLTQQPDSFDLAYLARELVQCTLPHSDPGDVPLWSRTNGNVTLIIARLGLDEKTLKPIGYPYGSLPRLLLFWMNTEAVQTGKRRIEMGDTFTDFIRQLGLDPSRGGARSDTKRLRNQMSRLFSAAIGFQRSLQDGVDQGQRLKRMDVVSDSELWWSPKQPNQVALWGSWIELGERFFEYITRAPVASDMRALRALKRSPLALDLYCWATHKALTVSSKGKSQFVPWIGLQRQFGTDYSSLKNFRQKAVGALKKIEAVYPGLKLQDAEGGIIVHSSSRPAVPYKPSRRLLNEE